MEKELKDKLEKEGEKKVKQIVNDIVDGTIKKVTGDTFLNIIKEGNAEFQAKTGRSLTYSEMRDLYG